MTQPTLLEAASLLQREAVFIDQRRWSEWLALYHDDCLFWLPTWRDDDTLIEDPRREVSFLYLQGKAALAERIRRLEQGKSITTHPLPRTCHIVSLPVLLNGGESPAWHSQWVNHLYDPRSHESTSFFGGYRHHFVREGAEWRIRQKVISLANDRIPTVLDLYSV